MKYNYGRQSIDFKDILEVLKVLRSPFLTQGPKVKEFEDVLCDYTGAKYAVAVANGTAALHLCMLAVDIQPGDEVITSPNTFLASANCVRYAGGTVRFADIDEKIACIDPEEIKKQLTDKTRGIIPVHFAGIPCDMEEISRIAEEKGLFVVEDAAHAIGSEYKETKVGFCKYSDMTIFSFHPVKTITTAEGGAITTNNKTLYEKLMALRSHGTYRGERWLYEMRELGFNYRLTDIQGALGLSQLKKLDKFKNKRRQLVELYKESFAGDERFTLLKEPVYSNACFHLCPLLIDFEKVKITKENLFDNLLGKGLNLQVHYIPVHTQPYYREYGYNWGDFPKAEEYYKKTISLPLYPGLNKNDIKQVTKIVKETVK